jgi:hypothetical protein
LVTAGAPPNLLILKENFSQRFQTVTTTFPTRPTEEIVDEKRLTVSQKECSNESSSNPSSNANLVVTVYSDSDAYSVVTLYSVVMNSDSLYSSSNRGLSLYSVVIRESCEL